jgi:hypothetical protein
MTTVRFSCVGDHRGRPKGLKIVTRSKTALTLPTAGSRGKAKLIFALLSAAFVWWIIANPSGAARTVTTVVESVVTFCRALGH